MTKEKISDVVESYALLLRGRGCRPERMIESGNWTPEFHHLRGTRENHLLWMTIQIQTFLDQDKLDKAFRWLGFIQGAFWVLDLRSVAEMKGDNKPVNETFDANRV